MCTVTFVPTTNNNFLFTSNRDEFVGRSASNMVREKVGKKTLLYPQDALAKGTWIALSDHNQLVCILNGAFKKHKHHPPYRLSRGIMALKFFSYDYAEDFFDEFNFTGIEPFTMIIFDNGALYELRWDEKKKHIKRLNTQQSHLWASCPLYSDEWIEKRQQWFKNWQTTTPLFNQDSILDFHKNAGEGNPEYDLVINRQNILQTTSITSIVRTSDKMSLRFENLLEGQVQEEDLLLQRVTTTRVTSS